MKLVSLFRHVLRGRRLAVRFGNDRRGVAAVEFAFILPLMLTLMLGMIDVSSGVAIDRKVTLTARTLSDLVSQGTKVSSTMTQKISAVSIDASKKAKVVWSYSGAVNGASSVTVTTGYAKDTVITTIPADLLVANTQLIWSEVTYTFTPITGYIIKTNVPLSEDCYTRPRQSDTVTYTS